MISLSRVAQLVGSDVGNGKPGLISRCLLSILQAHFRVEKNTNLC